jgi:hypothetical protein
MFTRKSGILALVLSVAVLGACDDDAPIVQPDPATIQIQPNPVPALAANAPFTLVAITANAPAGSTISWSSSNPNITVTQAGVVTCTTAGAGQNATITATISGTTPAVSAAVAVSCTGGGTIGTPTISISRITNPAGLDVNPGNVAGVVNVITNVDIPAGVAASAMRVTVNGTEVCRTSFASGAGADAAAAVPVTVVCSFNTAQLAANGTPLFPNGPQTIRAEILGPTGTVIANSSSQQLTFNNPSALLLTVTSAANATDQNGLRWEGGNLTVVVTPSIFTPNTALQSVSVSVTGLDTMGVTRVVTKTVATTGVAPVTVVFRSDSSSSAGLGLNGIEDPNTIVSATAVSGGQNFPTAGSFAAPAIRYDAAAPRLTGVVPVYNLAVHPVTGESFLVATSTFPTNCSATATPGVFNCGTAGTSAVAGTGVVDNGVDRVTMEFQTSSSTASPLAFTTRTSASAIGQQAADALVARLRVCDALANCKNTATANNSAAFGVDLISPFIQAVTNLSGVQTGSPVVAVAAVDTGAFSAGFNTVTGYVQVQIVKDSASSTGANVSRCVSVATGTSAANTAVPSSGACAFNTVANASGSFTIDPTISGYGYYTVTVRAVDIAGNISTTTQRFFLLDVTAPVVSNVTVTYTTGAATANASATIHDNVDLREYNSRVQFSGAIVGAANSLPFTTPTTHKAFGVPVSGNAAPSTAVPVIKGIQNGFGGAILGQISGIGFSAYDQANNYGEGYAAFTTTASAGVTATDVVSSSVTTASANVCQTGTVPPCGATVPASTTASAQIVMGVTATPNPITSVNFYYLDAAGRAVFISQTSAASLAIPSSGPNANQRVFTYTSGTIPTAALALGGNTIFAVGVDADGDAVLLGTATLTAQ